MPGSWRELLPTEPLKFRYHHIRADGVIAATLAIANRGPTLDTVNCGLAFVAPNDNPNRSIGRTIARGRAECAYALRLSWTQYTFAAKPEELRARIRRLRDQERRGLHITRGMIERVLRGESEPYP